MRMIQVGVGAWGASWASEVSASPHWTLAALVDSDPAQLDRGATTAGVHQSLCFPSLARALRAVQADAVLIVAPPSAHGTLALEALEAGMHCLIEKPLCPSIGEARTLVKRAESHGRALMASQNYRFNAGYRTLQAQVDAGAIGRVEAVHIDFRRTPVFHGFRTSMDEPLLMDMAVHHFDQARALVGGRPVEVRAHSFNPSWSAFEGNASALAEFVTDERAVVSYSGTWAGRGTETSWNGDWYLEGAEGALAWSGTEVRLFGPSPVQRGRIARRLRVREGRRIEPIELEETERRGVLAEFAASIREGREPETGGRDTLVTLELVFGAVEAAKSGLPVRLG